MELNKQFVSQEFKLFGNGKSWLNSGRLFNWLFASFMLNFIIYYFTEYLLFQWIFSPLTILLLSMPIVGYRTQEIVRGKLIGDFVIDPDYIRTSSNKIHWMEIRNFTFHVDGYRGEKRKTLTEYLAYHSVDPNYASGLKNYIEYKHLHNLYRHYFLLESRESYDLFLEVIKQQYYLGYIQTIKFRSSFGFDYAELQTHKKLREKVSMEISRKNGNDTNE